MEAIAITLGVFFFAALLEIVLTEVYTPSNAVLIAALVPEVLANNMTRSFAVDHIVWVTLATGLTKKPDTCALASALACQGVIRFGNMFICVCTLLLYCVDKELIVLSLELNPNLAYTLLIIY